MRVVKLAVTTATHEGLSAVVGMLLARRVALISLEANRPPQHDFDGFEVRLAVQVEDDNGAELLVKRLNRMVDVVKVVKVTPSQFFQLRATLVKVEADDRGRRRALDIAGAFDARVLELTPRHVTFAVMAGGQDVQNFIDVLGLETVTEIVDATELSIRRGASLPTGPRQPLEDRDDSRQLKRIGGSH